ncbi:rod shape-determining protein MreC [Candidatus Desantisbacteria bacterium CG1_02_38_46]|uniref:Cell shape-determining protein MreC n=2 Tax=unclassified Candidatus Desantisiibacteriota TaxID=3106372 RepID=A0A2H9PBQ4_9BACT|nr:MAG: rod shape-determining protein MreC [Candidatus Desantisbacteria bacterium CG1_02_38_46]PIZ16303.1 MAG: rod shape-determining protein MreC [Candidatus Desantisbacteria bacterium CG_4_10_14_0_8_um_filter_39_17]
MRRYLILSSILVFVGFFLQLPGIRNATRTAFLFPSKVIQGTLNGLGGFFSFLYHAKQVEEENRFLKEQLNEVETQNSLYRAKISELERLRKYESLSSNLFLSKVIARDPGNWFKTLFIDKGEESGVTLNMVALLPDGVVGRIIEVSPKCSTVLLAVDRGSKIAAIVRETREFGVVEGMESFIQMSFFNRDIQVKPGDTVLTSGLGGTFPKGLILGKITQVKKGGLVPKADIEPAVDFNKLEEVFILLK